jgi:LysR family glycine cleavage system transcriptional activator
MHEAVNSVQPEEHENSLLVACGPPFAAKWLVPRLPRFLADNPEIDIRITSSFEFLDYRAREVDIGIRLTNDNDPSLERLWLGEETMLVMAAPDFIERNNISKPQDIIGLPLLSEDTSGHFDHAPTWDDWFEKAGLPKGEGQRGINFGEYVEQALDAAIGVAGLVLGRKVLASKDIQLGNLTCLFGYELPTGLQYQVVCRKEVKHKAHAIAFKDWLAFELGQSLSLPLL